MDYSERIAYFSFCEPVIFTLTDNPGTTSLSKWGYYIGSLADQYASLTSETFEVKAERIDARKIYFEKGNVNQVPLFDTVLKVSSYILSGGILPTIALIIKLAFKIQLNACKILTKASPNEILAEKQIGKTKIVLLYGDLTEETTDIIVNAANERLLAGAGLCGAISKAAGKDPFKECKTILAAQKRKQIDIGEAVLTTAGDLAPRVKAIVHAVGPDYRVKAEKENGEELLTAAFQNSLEIAQDPNKHANYVSDNFTKQALHSISFPSLSTGIFQAPLDQVAPIALKTVKEFVEKNPSAFEEVRFVFLPINKDPTTGPAFKTALEAL